MRATKIVSIAALILLLTSAARAQFDIPGREGLVNDFASKLTPEAKQSLDARLREFTTRHQVELDVVIIHQDQLKGRPIEEYSVQMANKWGIGAGLGKVGLLLLVAIGPADAQGIYRGSTRLEVSRRLEADITNEVAGEIIRQMRDDLRAGRFSDAIQRGIDGADRALAKKLDQPAQTVSEESSRWFMKGTMFLLAISFIVVASVSVIIVVIFRRRAQQRVESNARVSKQKTYSKSQVKKSKRRGKSRASSPVSSYQSDSTSFTSYDTDSYSTTSDWGSSSSSDSSSSDSSSSSGDFGGGGASDSW
jgi:uncharacterized membrane protein YgcG